MVENNYAGLITVRTSSSRLPNKCLLPFGDCSVVVHVAKRAINFGIRPIICTSIDPSDDVLENIAKDLAALGEIRARILAHPKINSLNFTIDVVNGIAYLSGISSNEEEINLVTNIAKQARFVKEVYNYIKINSEKR